MKAVVILGCEGRQDDGFRFCSGVENVILDLEKLALSNDYLNIIKYLDEVVKIFESPCCNTNVVSNALYKFYETGCITDVMHRYISHFVNMHQRCGLVLYAKPKGAEE